jgi:hypothetical protein
LDLPVLEESAFEFLKNSDFSGTYSVQKFRIIPVKNLRKVRSKVD